jgi:hypothetical protein
MTVSSETANGTQCCDSVRETSDGARGFSGISSNIEKVRHFQQNRENSAFYVKLGRSRFHSPGELLQTKDRRSCTFF